jgi:hypothetical protein
VTCQAKVYSIGIKMLAPGCAPFIAPWDSIQAALSPKLFLMTSSEEGHIGFREAAGFKDRISLSGYGVQSIFDIEVQDYRQIFLLSLIVMEYAVYFCQLALGASSLVEGLLLNVNDAIVFNSMIQH